MLRIQWNVAQGGTAIHFIPRSHDTLRESSVADGTNDLQRLHTNVETQSWTLVAGFAVTWQSSRWELYQHLLHLPIRQSGHKRDVDVIWSFLKKAFGTAYHLFIELYSKLATWLRC